MIYPQKFCAIFFASTVVCDMSLSAVTRAVGGASTTSWSGRLACGVGDEVRVCMDQTRGLIPLIQIFPGRGYSQVNERRNIH